MISVQASSESGPDTATLMRTPKRSFSRASVDALDVVVLRRLRPRRHVGDHLVPVAVAHGAHEVLVLEPRILERHLTDRLGPDVDAA